MDYSRVDFSQISVEQVFRCAAEDLYQAAHKARAKAHLKLQKGPLNGSSEALEDQVAEAAFNEMLSVRSAYMMLYACENQLRSNVTWANAAGRGAFQWSKTGREIAIAMRAVQIGYSKLQDAAMGLPGSVGKDRARYLSLVANPSDAIEQEMVNALLVLKNNP